MKTQSSDCGEEPGARGSSAIWKYFAFRGALNIALVNAGTTLAALLVAVRNEDTAPLAGGDTSQHALLVAVTKLTGGGSIPTILIAEAESRFSTPAIPRGQRAEAAAGTTTIAITRTAATSLERGVIYEMIVPGRISGRCD